MIMPVCNKIRKKYNGSILPFILIIMTVVLIILLSLLSYISAQMKYSYVQVEREKAFQTAEAGIYYYRWYLAHQIAGKTVQQIKTFWQTGNPLGVATPYRADYYDPEGGKIGSYEISVTPPDPNSTIVIVKSTGWTDKKPDLKRIVQARFRRPSWSEYAVLANDFMRFGQGTEVFGKIHSNAGIRFDGLAHNIVSSALSTFDDPDHSGGAEFSVHTHVNPPPQTGVNDTYRSAEAPPNTPAKRADVFLGGRQFLTPTVDFNGVVSDLGNMKTESQIAGSGKYFDGTGVGRQIILKTDGTFDAYPVNAFDSGDSNSITSYIGTKNSDGSGSSCATTVTTAGPNTQCKDITSGQKCYCKHDNYPIPNGGVIFVENNVWLEGTVNNKRVTIAAAKLSGSNTATMFLGNNNLLYTNFNGKDVLGVIGQNDIEIIENSQNYLTIDGALIAQTGRVGRDNYGSSDHKNSITVNGSLATNLRYGFAWTNGVSDWGYTTRVLNFDNNLLYFPPPYFPTGTEYAIDLWEEL